MKVLATFILLISLSYLADCQQFSYCTHPDDLWTVWPDWDNASNFVTCYWNDVGRYRFNPCPRTLLFAFHLQYCTFEVNWRPPPPPNEITPFPPPGTSPLTTETTTQGNGTTEPIETTTQDPSDTTQGIGTTDDPFTTQPPPGAGACFAYHDLYDGDRYIKTLCLVTFFTNYDVGRRTCSTLDMNLFIIDNDLVQTLFFNASTQILSELDPEWPYTHVWINGRYDQAWDVWTVQDPEDNQIGTLYDGIDWVDTEFIEGRTNGPCLRYTAEFGHFQAIGVDCEINSMVICEHYKYADFPTESTTTVTMPSPTDPPNLDFCNLRKDLYNGQNYLKSLCIVSSPSNYDVSRINCAEANMNLFIIDTALIHTLFFNATSELLPVPGVPLWINGRKTDFVNIWTVRNPDDSLRGLLHTGMDWVQTDEIDGRLNGPCLRYTSEFGFFQGLGMECDQVSWFVCEFEG